MASQMALVWPMLVSIVMAVVDLVRITALSIWYIVEAAVVSVLPRRLRAKSVVGELVLITGAGGGIGRLVARRFSELGARVIVWDKDEQGVRETVSQVRAAGGEAYGYIVDLADRGAIYRTAEKVKAEIGKVTILINNAGIVFGKTLLELPDQEIDTTFQVNILAHYWTTKAFLGDMLADDHGHIVTVASVAGLMGTYRCTDYSASKFAAVGFHESLFTELQAQGHRNIYTTLICPYFINTGMFEGVKPRLMAMLEPSHVADELVAAVLANEVTVTLPGCFRWLMPLKGILPAKLCWALMYHIMQGPQAMMTFRGRQKTASNS